MILQNGNQETFFLFELCVEREGKHTLSKKYWRFFLIVVTVQRVCAGGESIFSAAGGEGPVFTEQLIQASSENLFHLVSGLHSVQML